jgi:aminomethyltransferase
MYNRIRSLQTEDYQNQALVFQDRVMKSPLDSAVISWKTLPSSELFSNKYRCKKEFLSLSQVIINAIGMPTSVCVLAGTIMGSSSWESVSIERQHRAIHESAGVFEASSMTYLSIKGPDSVNILNKLTPRNIYQLKPGQAKFIIFTTTIGAVDDDAMILRISDDEFLLSCGGSKLPQQALSYLPQVLHEFPNAIISSPDMVSFNIKGPARIAAMLHLVQDTDKHKVVSLSDFEFCQVKTLNGNNVWILKTKIGIEMWANVNTLSWAWAYMLNHPEIYTPCGWDVLHSYRMDCEEILLTVYPFDIHDATTLWEIDCGWMTYEKDSDYIGKKALAHGKDKKILELKKIKASSQSSQAAKVGSILNKNNGDFAGYITSSAFSIKAERALAFAHLLVGNNDCKKFYIQGTKEEWELLR